MVKITYSQECDQNSKRTSCSYFYVRTHSFEKFNFSGKWDLSEGATFSVYRSEYHYYPLSVEFWVCSVSKSFEENKISIYPSRNVASVSGKFQIITESNNKLYAFRLMEWWNKGDGSIEYAQLCAKYLKPRIKEIPSFELEKLKVSQPQPTDAVLGGDSAFQKWLSTAAVLGGKAKSLNNDRMK